MLKKTNLLKELSKNKSSKKKRIKTISPNWTSGAGLLDWARLGCGKSTPFHLCWSGCSCTRSHRRTRPLFGSWICGRTPPTQRDGGRCRWQLWPGDELRMGVQAEPTGSDRSHRYTGSPGVLTHNEGQITQQIWQSCLQTCLKKIDRPACGGGVSSQCSCVWRSRPRSDWLRTFSGLRLSSQRANIVPRPWWSLCKQTHTVKTTKEPNPRDYFLILCSEKRICPPPAFHQLFFLTLKCFRSSKTCNTCHEPQVLLERCWKTASVFCVHFNIFLLVYCRDLSLSVCGSFESWTAITQQIYCRCSVFAEILLLFYFFCAAIHSNN